MTSGEIIVNFLWSPLGYALEIGVVAGIVLWERYKRKKRVTDLPTEKKKDSVQLGEEGEQEVAMELSKLDSSKYISYHDIYIRRGDGSTVQVDHLVLSRFGIFVIETKNYSGKIYATLHKTWVQYPGKGPMKRNFQNPLHQNYGHVESLKEILGNHIFHPIVCFTRKAEIKGSYNWSEVTTSDELLTLISACSNEEVILESVIGELTSTLETAMLEKTDDLKQSHVEKIQTKIASGR
jgi:hypothetical protein